jgi:hypothetical protein
MKEQGEKENCFVPITMSVATKKVKGIRKQNGTCSDMKNVQ